MCLLCPQSTLCDSVVNTTFHISLPSQTISLWRMELCLSFFFFFCLSSSELWCLARSRETGNVSSGCLNRLLPTSFSPFHFAWISANWPRTFPLSLSWPVEIRMLTKPLWEFGVIRLSHTLYECVECFSKAYTYVVAHLLFCQLDDHKLFSNPEIESQTHMVLK